jgi:hypothetical protein
VARRPHSTVRTRSVFSGGFWDSCLDYRNELSSDLTLVVQTENEDDFGYAQIEADELEASYSTGEGKLRRRRIIQR